MSKRKKSKFLRIRCQKCKNEQVIFSRASTVIKCTKCEEILSEPKGGKAEIKALILEELK